MKVLLLGASGATGSLVKNALLEKSINVCAIVRNPETLKKNDDQNLEIIKGNVLDLPEKKLGEIINECAAAISCLGHNITLKGIYGKPHLLVTNSVKRICEVAKAQNRLFKFVLMNTTANRNRDVKESYSIGDRIVLGIFNLLLPPQNDNVNAAKYLSKTIGHNKNIEWIAVRPDTLINESGVSGYTVVEGIRRSPVFDAGKVSRINVSDFITRLLCDENEWNKWKYEMPVIYNNSFVR